VKYGFATFVPGVADMPKAVSSLAASFDLLIKPKLNQLTFHIQEYGIPVNDSAPLYPLYDKNRNVIWLGDSAVDKSSVISNVVIPSSKSFVQIF
jgi:hypothetical protein